MSAICSECRNDAGHQPWCLIGRASGILAAGRKAAATKLTTLENRADCIKVLRLGRAYEAVRLLEGVTDDEYGAIVARAVGPARGPKTPPGYVIDLDGPATPRRPPSGS